MRIVWKSTGTWKRVVFSFWEINHSYQILETRLFSITFSSRFSELKGAQESTELSRLHFLIRLSLLWRKNEHSGGCNNEVIILYLNTRVSHFFIIFEKQHRKLKWTWKFSFGSWSPSLQQLYRQRISTKWATPFLASTYSAPEKVAQEFHPSSNKSTISSSKTRKQLMNFSKSWNSTQLNRNELQDDETNMLKSIFSRKEKKNKLQESKFCS